MKIHGPLDGLRVECCLRHVNDLVAPAVITRAPDLVTCSRIEPRSPFYEEFAPGAHFEVRRLI